MAERNDEVLLDVKRVFGPDEVAHDGMQRLDTVAPPVPQPDQNGDLKYRKLLFSKIRARIAAHIIRRSSIRWIKQLKNLDEMGRTELDGGKHPCFVKFRRKMQLLVDLSNVQESLCQEKENIQQIASVNDTDRRVMKYIERDAILIKRIKNVQLALNKSTVAMAMTERMQFMTSNMKSGYIEYLKQNLRTCQDLIRRELIVVKIVAAVGETFKIAYQELHLLILRNEDLFMPNEYQIVEERLAELAHIRHMGSVLIWWLRFNAQSQKFRRQEKEARRNAYHPPLDGYDEYSDDEEEKPLPNLFDSMCDVVPHANQPPVPDGQLLPEPI